MAKNITRIAMLFVLFVFVPAARHAQSADQPDLGNFLYLPVISNPGYLYLPTVIKQEPPDPLAWLGLEGGPVQVIAIDPQDSNVLYLGTWGSGVYKSTDGGQNWTPARIGLGNQLIWSLVVDPYNSSIIYVGTHKDGVYKSVDGGSTWAPASNGLQNSAVVYSIAINPANSRNIFIGTRGIAAHCGGDSCPPWAGVIYRSDNGGASWTPSLSNVGGASKQFWAYSVVFDPVDSMRTLAAFDGSPGLLRSLDAGNTWSTVTKPPQNPLGRVVIFDTTYTTTVVAYYGGWQAYQYNNVYRSNDGGDSWASKTSGVGGDDVWKMAITRSSPSTVYLGTFSDGLWMTTDGALAWKKTGFPTQRLSDVEVDPKDSNLLYVGAFNTGLYKSNDGGTTWGLSQHGLITTWSTSLLVSPGDKNYLTMSTYGQGVFQSPDRGLTWNNMSAGLGDLFIHSMVLDPAHPDVLFALTDTQGLYRYNLSAGGSWVHIAGGLPALAVGQAAPTSLSYGPNYPFSVPEKPDSDVHPEIYANQKPAAPTASPPYLAMSFAPSAPNMAYLGTNGSGVFKSSNSGGAWSPAGLSGFVVWSLAVDLVNPDLVYAATSTAGTVKVSTNGGASWSNSNLPAADLTVYSLALSTNGLSTLYAGTNNGVYQMAGGVWTALGLSGNTVTSVAANPSAPGYLYAGTTNGAFYSPNAGVMWQPGLPQLANLTIQSINFDTTFPFMVYYCTTANGALRVPY